MNKLDLDNMVGRIHDDVWNKAYSRARHGVAGLIWQLVDFQVWTPVADQIAGVVFSATIPELKRIYGY